MTVAFMGLTGPSGVLPLFYTKLLMERRKAGDRTLAAFLDLLNHRLISLFYRAWEKYHVIVPYERGEDDRFSRSLFHLIGLGTRGLRDRHDFPDEALLFYAGHFARRRRPAVVLEDVLRDAFGHAGGGPAVRRAMAPARAGRPLDPGQSGRAQSSWGSAWSWARASGTSRASSGSASGR